MRTSLPLLAATAAFAAGLAGMAPAWGQSAPASYGSAWPGQQGMISAGSAPIARALATLIPEPYRIELDARVPRDWVVAWPAGDNWMQVLQQALAPMGLVVEPDWGSSTVRVVYAPQSARPAAADPAPRPPEVPPQQTVSGDLGPQWEGRAPAPPKEPVRLDSAVLRLLPPSLSSAAVAMQGVDTSALVRWSPGLTRQQALSQVLQSVGAVLRLDGGVVRVLPRPQTPTPSNPASRVRSLYTAATMPLTAPTAASAAAQAPSGLRIEAGKPVGQQMREQAAAQGWSVVWRVDHDWVAPASAVFSGPFDRAAAQAIEAMAAEGAPVSATVYTANHTIVVSQTGAAK